MTIAYEPEGGGSGNSDCTPASDENRPAPLSRADTADVVVSVPNSATDDISASWTTPTNEPNVGDWPNGTYRGSYECTAINTELSAQVQILRINSGCTIQQTLATSGEFAGTGTHSVSTATDPTAGAAGDRYQMRLLGDSTNTHGGAKTLTVQVNNVNTFMDGPWVVSVDEIIQHEFPDDVGLFVHGLTQAEVGIQRPPLADDVVQAADSREFPDDLALFTHGVSRDELDFQQTPLSSDQIISEVATENEFPTDLRLYQQPVTEDEGGIFRKEVGGDVEIPTPVEFPDDLSAYLFPMIESEFTFLRSVPSAPSVLDKTPYEFPFDLSRYEFPLTPNESGFQTSVPAESIQEPPSPVEFPDDLSVYLFPTIDAERGATRNVLSSDSVFDKTPYEFPIDAFWYEFPITGTELGTTSSPLPADAVAIASNPSQSFPSDVSLFAHSTIGAEFTWTSPVPAAENIVAVNPQEFPRDLSLFEQPISDAEFTWTTPVPPKSEPLAAHLHEFPVDSFWFEHQPISDELSFSHVPLPADVTWVTKGHPFLFTAANWDPAGRFHLEAHMRAVSGTFQARLYNLTDGVEVVGSGVVTSLTVDDRIRGSAVPLIDGKEYVVQFGHEGSNNGAFRMARLIQF